MSSTKKIGAVACNNPTEALASVISFAFVVYSLACKQALRMGYSEICFRIARRRAKERRLGFFDRNVGLCCSCFSVAMGDRAIFVDSSNDAR